MGRIVAIAGGNLQSTFPINRFIVNMDKKNNHNLVFVGTASEDAEGYINNIRIMLVDNYSVFYTICEEKAIVTDVLYTASDIEARLRGV